MAAIDPALKEFTTAHRGAQIDAINEAGSVDVGCERLGINSRTFRRWLGEIKVRAARQGHAPGHFDAGVAPGYLMGKVTVQRARTKDGDSVVERVWERQHPEDHRFAAALRAIDGAADNLPRLAPLPAPPHTLRHLLNLYVFSDYHLGMRAWVAEGGADWNLEIAEDLIVRCFEHMVATAPAARVGFIAQLGDFLHFDSLLPVTPTSGHVMDAAAHYEQIVDAALRIMRRLIDFALHQHAEVVVLAAEGNHDISGSMWLRVALKALYENEPRLTVIQSASPYYAYEHGKTMLAFSHGHLAKLEQLPMLFADRFSEMWGRTKKRYVHGGHNHHELVIKEMSGMRAIQHPTLAPKDSHTARHGYGANQQTSYTTYHEAFGKVSEQVVTPEMLYCAA